MLGLKCKKLLSEIRISLVKTARRAMSILAKRANYNGIPSYLLRKCYRTKSAFPKGIDIELTNACNLRCIHCPRQVLTRDIGYMDFGLFKDIVDQCKAYMPRIFGLHKYGEPLLHKNLLECIQYIKSRNKRNYIYLFTNGQLLDEKSANEILNLGVDMINFSIGANKDTTYRTIRGGELSIVEDNIRHLIRLKEKKKSNILIKTQIIRMQETENEIKEFVLKWKKMGTDVKIQPYVSWDNHYSSAKNKTFRYPCPHLFRAIDINWDGRVGICCIDYDAQEIIGDVNKDTLFNIWNGEKINMYREMHLQGNYEDIGICKRCEVWSW